MKQDKHVSVGTPAINTSANNALTSFNKVLNAC